MVPSWGWVTTTFGPSKTAPPPTGIEPTVASTVPAPPASVGEAAVVDAAEPPEEPQAARTAAPPSAHPVARTPRRLMAGVSVM